MPLNLSLATALFGISTGTTSTGDATSALLALKQAQTGTAETKGIEAEKKDPISITALKQFDSALAKAKDVNTALKDPRILNVLLPALGLADQASFPGLVQKALTADPNDSKGLLASLDGRFKAAAQTLDLRNKGLDGLKDPATVQKLKDGYLEYQYKAGLDDTNPGFSDALYFIENAGAQTDVYNILGNSVLRRVVTGALGLPDAIAVQSVEAQARAITSRMKLDDLQDSRKVQLLAQRYVMARADQSTAATNPLLSLLA
ncbi:DUF1217 domain-containing protein [Siccirubricoccus phaeus]|uniref:DUF1217 domain-containing protein n=1 Tax=Siccirubricoccus phaeus TaxID=2595053 RepID=UPI0011F1A59E|nr:DUF1217 domain-containing protein [Siccirubricoccus phaeus]